MTPHRDACGSRDRPVPDSGGNVLGPKGFVERKAGDDIECGHEAGAEVLFVDGGGFGSEAITAGHNGD
jgi:hypothetical protein